MSLAARLKEARESAGLSARALSEKAGLSSGYVAMVEAGTRDNITLGTAQKLADALGIAFVWLVAGVTLADESGPLPASDDTAA